VRCSIIFSRLTAAGEHGGDDTALSSEVPSSSGDRATPTSRAINSAEMCETLANKLSVPRPSSGSSVELEDVLCRC